MVDAVSVNGGAGADAGGAAGGAEASGVALPGCLAELIEISEERRQLDAREAALLADPSVGMATLVEFGHRVPQWLAAATKQSRAAAGKRVRTAERVHMSFPELLEALDAGRVGWNHVEVFCRAANPRIRAEMAELLPALIELAEVASFDRWCQEIRGIAARLDQDGGYDPNADPANNSLRLTPSYDGSIEVSGRLVGEMAWRITKLIDAETERVLDQHRADVAEMYPNGDAPNSAMPPRSRAAAEALGELIERGAMTADTNGRTLTAELSVTWQRNPHTGNGELVDSDSGEHLPTNLVDWFTETAAIRPIELDADGDPLRVGRARRYATATQRRTLALRDGGCVFPGCDRPPSWCDAHHVQHWEHGGGTDTDNLALLCRHHHRLTHQPGWAMTHWRADTSQFNWTTPTGRTLRSQRHQREPLRPETVRASSRE